MPDLWYPGGKRYPISRLANRPTIDLVAVVLHTEVGSTYQTGSNFGDWCNSNGGGTASTFYGDHDGLIWQYAEVNRKCACSKSADAWSCSVETWDGAATTGTVPAWNDAQIDGLAGLLRWLDAEWGVPLIGYDKPDGAKGPGDAYHSLPARYSDQWDQPPGPPDGYNPWTSSQGKPCPAEVRIKQIPTIIQLARGGAPPQDEEEPEMFLFTAPNGQACIHQGAKLSVVAGPDDKTALLKVCKDIGKVSSTQWRLWTQDLGKPSEYAG